MWEANCLDATSAPRQWSRSRRVSGVPAGPFAQAVQGQEGPEGPVAEGLGGARAELGDHAVQRGRRAGFGESVEIVDLLAQIRERGVILGEQAL